MTASEVIGIVVATFITVILRWAANRWPIPEGKPHKHKKHECEECEEET